MISAELLSITRCADCGGPLDAITSSRARCRACRREFDGSKGYLDLRPKAAFAEQTKYLDEALHADARHESIGPPLLGSRIRNDRLRAFLSLGPEDIGLDLGCGSGRALVWNADRGARLVGIDISPFFAREAVERGELLLGDLRRLPLHDASFTKAWSLDVLEHLSPEALRDVLREAHRVLAPGGALFVYTHVRKNGWIARGVRLVNRFARLCERAGLLDLRQERLRKSDHLNPIADHTELRRIVGESGFTIERITYYTPIVGACVENVLIRIAERAMIRRVSRAPTRQSQPKADSPARVVRAAGKALMRRRGPSYLAVRLLTSAMAVDVWLFGRIQSGPFFALLRKGPRPQAQGPS
jgi:SAM-dependent methyltransferase